MVRPDGFNTQRRAELLIDMGRASEAEPLLLLLPLLAERAPEWVERLLARTRLTLGDPGGALLQIDSALSHLKAEHFRSEFLELRYDIRCALQDPDAFEDLEKAITANQKKAEARRPAKRLRNGSRAGDVVAPKGIAGG